MSLFASYSGFIHIHPSKIEHKGNFFFFKYCNTIFFGGYGTGSFVTANDCGNEVSRGKRRTRRGATSRSEQNGDSKRRVAAAGKFHRLVCFGRYLCTKNFKVLGTRILRTHFWSSTMFFSITPRLAFRRRREFSNFQLSNFDTTHDCILKAKTTTRAECEPRQKQQY